MASEAIELDQRAVRNHLLRGVRFELPKNGQTPTEEIIRLKLAAQEEAIPAIGDTVERLVALYGMGMEGIQFPQHPKQQIRLAELVQRAIEDGRPVELVAPTCPDYAHRYDPELGREIFTFEYLGSGVGLTGQKLLDVVPAFLERLGEQGIPVQFRVLVADVEADDPEILSSVSLHRNRFLAKCHRSRRQIAESLPNNATARMMSEFLSGADYERASHLMEGVSRDHVFNVGTVRSDLYERWFGMKNGGNDLYTRRARADIEKSLAFGSAARRQGVIVMEATDPQLASHYMKGDDLPVAPLIMIENSY